MSVDLSRFSIAAVLVAILVLAYPATKPAVAQSAGAPADRNGNQPVADKPATEPVAERSAAEKTPLEKSTEPASAQPAASDGPSSSAETKPTVSVSLTSEQAKLAAKYKELERVILRMAEVMQATDPKRAALLRQAFAQSKDRQIDSQYEELIKLLRQEQLYQASKSQVAMQQDLDQLLQLLLSGEREKQIPNERAEIKRFIERINKLIREEQGLQGETEGQGDDEDLIKQQDGIAKKTAALN
ncbi:MAG TPA: hypothetical protein VFE46_19890, partial [Pirellulales bacterium]|nr:hypothetical protein [Pirellulales bacterium]